MIGALLLCLALVHGLRVRTTPAGLYYGIPKGSRVAIFSTGQYKFPSMQEILLRLLQTRDFRFSDDYTLSRLPNGAAKALLQRFFSTKGLHALVFPFRLVCRTPFMVNFIGRHLLQYQPGVIRLADNQSAFNSDRMEIIFSKLGRDGLRLGDVFAAQQALRLGYLPFSQDRGLLKCIAHVVLDLDTSRIWSACQNHYQVVGVCATLYPTARQLLEDTVEMMPQVEQTFWHSMLLIILLRGTTRDDRSLVRRFLLEFFLRNNVDNIPLFLLEQIVLTCSEQNLKINAGSNRRLAVEMRKIRTRFPLLRSIGGNVMDYVYCWSQYLHTIGGHVLQVSSSVQRMDDLILWWADYDCLEEVLLVNPILPHALRIQNDKGTIQCRTMYCLLQTLTEIFNDHTRIVQIISNPRGRHDMNQPYVVLKAFARTILSNILFLGSVNFKVPRGALTWLERADAYDPLIFKLLHGLCHFTKMIQYVPLNLTMQMPRMKSSFVPSIVMVVMVFSLLIHDVSDG
ncbi:hypothetical protein PSACC_00188 [Paramicrosporidium saccamoebae]|uniref:Uncharacterized protein n=1 Tax=Paramicrosporidium saccamoebae TaxID=1246581 RepID=A0A2H9TQJ8_9FUNG|nr:hypothetical protein PSACC_00188 [Paramicrosporidium saccamoebae]